MVRMTKSGDWEKFRKRLKKVSQNMTKLVGVVQGESLPIQVDMKSRARVKTGFMRDHILIFYEPSGFTVWSQAPYSGFQEYGTSRGITPNLFWRPPLDLGWKRIQKGLMKKVMS